MTSPDPFKPRFKRYVAFGQTIAADRPIPFPAAGDVSRPDVELVENRAACIEGPPIDASLLHEVEDFRQGPRLEVYRANAHIWINYVGYRFRIALAQRRIDYCEVEETGAAVGFDGLIERVVLPLYLLFASAETVGVHGGSVVIDGAAWAFIGNSGAGKSTTARVLVEQGARLLADDLTLVDVARTYVLPGCPAVRLWEEQGAVPLAIEDRPESSLRTKRWFRFPAACAAIEPAPLVGVIVLDACTPQDTLAPQFSPITGQSAFSSLMAQVFDISRPEPSWSRDRFKAVAKLARHVPVFRYTYARSATGEPTHVGPLVEFIASRNGESNL